MADGYDLVHRRFINLNNLLFQWLFQPANYAWFDIKFGMIDIFVIVNNFTQKEYQNINILT